MRIIDIPQIMRSEHFNATSSLLLFPACPQMALREQTCMARIYPEGAGENNLGTVICITAASNNFGFRLAVAHGAGSPTIHFSMSSSGTAGSPRREAANGELTYNNWYTIAATFDGGILGAGASLYKALDLEEIAEVSSYATTFDGSGVLDLVPTNPMIIGNRGNSDRTFNGRIAYVCRWSRRLSLTEMREVQLAGPLSVPNHLVFLWANGQDYGPYNLFPSSRTAITFRGPPPSGQQLGPLPLVRARYRALDLISGFNPAWARGANTVITPGVRVA